MLRKFAVSEAVSAWIVPEGASLAAISKAAHRTTFEYQVRPGFLYVRSRMVSSRCNDNWDEFPAEEIEKSYRTFLGKPVFVNHSNINHRRARGAVIRVALHRDRNPDGTPDTWAEGLMEVDARTFPKLAAAILAGRIDRTSMGVDVDFSKCSACGNIAADVADYCQHIPAMKGRKHVRYEASGRQRPEFIRETCYGLRFFENSLLVEEPADPTAVFTGVDSRGLQMAASRRTAADGEPDFRDHLGNTCLGCGDRVKWSKHPSRGGWKHYSGTRDYDHDPIPSDPDDKSPVMQAVYGGTHCLMCHDPVRISLDHLHAPTGGWSHGDGMKRDHPAIPADPQEVYNAIPGIKARRQQASRDMDDHLHGQFEQLSGRPLPRRPRGDEGQMPPDPFLAARTAGMEDTPGEGKQSHLEKLIRHMKDRHGLDTEVLGFGAADAYQQEHGRPITPQPEGDDPGSGPESIRWRTQALQNMGEASTGLHLLHQRAHGGNGFPDQSRGLPGFEHSHSLKDDLVTHEHHPWDERQFSNDEGPVLQPHWYARDKKIPAAYRHQERGYGLHPERTDQHPNRMAHDREDDPGTWSNLGSCSRVYNDDARTFPPEHKPEADGGPTWREAHDANVAAGHMCPECGAYKYMHASQLPSQVGKPKPEHNEMAREQWDEKIRGNTAPFTPEAPRHLSRRRTAAPHPDHACPSCGTGGGERLHLPLGGGITAPSNLINCPGCQEVYDGSKSGEQAKIDREAGDMAYREHARAMGRQIDTFRHVTDQETHPMVGWQEGHAQLRQRELHEHQNTAPFGVPLDPQGSEMGRKLYRTRRERALSHSEPYPGQEEPPLFHYSSRHEAGGKTGPKYPDPADHPWFQARPVSALHVIRAFHDTTQGERADGKSWYQDAHHVAKAIAGGDAAKGAGVIAAYSPRTFWQANLHHASRSLREGRAIGPGEGASVMTLHQRAAQRIMDGEHWSTVLKGPKTRAFAHLIEHGGETDDDRLNGGGPVVIDRHAMSVATGKRLTDAEMAGAPIDTQHYYDHVVHQYREASRRLSEHYGEHISPDHVQAGTWERQVRRNQAEDAAGGGFGGGGRTTRQNNDRAIWRDMAREHHPAIQHLFTGSFWPRTALPGGIRFHFRPASADQDMHHLWAATPGRTKHTDMAHFRWHPVTGEVGSVTTPERLRRDGVATALWDRARELSAEHGLAIPQHSDIQFPEGQAWAHSVDSRGLADPVQGQQPLIPRKRTNQTKTHEAIRGYLASRTASDMGYRMQHQGPDADDGEGMHEIGSGKVYPRDFHERSWEYQQDASHDSMDKVHRSRGWPSRKVWVYRALPAPHREVNPGDWVSTSKEYARNEGRVSSNPDHDYPVVKFQARAEHLRNDGNSLDEWSYHGPPVQKALVHFRGGADHKKIPWAPGRTDARGSEHEPPEMYSAYEQASAEYRRNFREQRQQREGQLVRRTAITGESAGPGHDIWAVPHGTSPVVSEVEHNMGTREPGQSGETWYHGTTYHGPYHMIRHPETRSTHVVDAQGRDASIHGGGGYGNHETNGSWGERSAEQHWHGLESAGPDRDRTGTREEPSFKIMKERTPAFPHSRIDPLDEQRAQRPDARVHAPEGYSPEDEYHGSYEVVKHPETGEFHVIDNAGRRAPGSGSWQGHATQMGAERSRDYIDRRQQSKEKAKGIAENLFNGIDDIFDPGGTEESRNSDRNIQAGEDLMGRYAGGKGKVRFDDDEEGGAPYYQRDHFLQNGKPSGWYVKHYGGTHADIYHHGTPDEAHELIRFPEHPDDSNSMSPRIHPDFDDISLGKALKNWHDDSEGGGREYLEQSDPRIKRWKMRHQGVRHQAYGETRVPPEVDTLREEECPVCGEQDVYSGDRCPVCGFVSPPQMFKDPDLERAKQMDLRQDQQADGGMPGMPQPGMQVPGQEASGQLPDAQQGSFPDADGQLQHPDQIAPDGVPGEMGATEDQQPVLTCTACGVTVPAAGAVTQTTTPEQPAAMGFREGDPCPNCGQGVLVSSDDIQMAQGMPPGAQSNTGSEALPGAGDMMMSQQGPSSSMPVSPEESAAILGQQPMLPDGPGGQFPEEQQAAADESEEADEAAEEGAAEEQQEEEDQDGPPVDDDDPDMKGRSRKSSREGSRMSDQMVLDQLRLIASQNRRLLAQNGVLRAQVRAISTLAGCDAEMAAIERTAALRFRADMNNPASPVPDPPQQPASESTEQTLMPDTMDDPRRPGMTPGSVTNLPAMQTTTPLRPGVEDQVPPATDLVDPTAPVTGTNPAQDGGVPLPQRRIETDVRVGDPMNPEIAFPWNGNVGPDSGQDAMTGPQQGAGQQQRAAARQPGADDTGRTRVMASIRLARLRVTSGLARGDEMTVAGQIESDASLTLPVIEHEIATLSQLGTRQLQSRHRTASARTAPSLAGEPRRAMASAGAVPADYAPSGGDLVGDADLFM